MKRLLISALTILTLASCSKSKDGEFTIHILTTNDVHGCYFDSTYVGGQPRNSLLSVSTCADSIRAAAGKGNVILLDAGDFLQGDNAAYYFNYVDTAAEHIFTRMAAYMQYDVVVAGNHDIETGHPVYDKVARELTGKGIKFLAGNAIRNDNGKPYFPAYTVLEKAGLKVAVLGFDNANIKGWLDESLWSGMHFDNLIPLVQDCVDEVIEKEHPHAVVVAVHSGSGKGDGTILESQALDLYKSLRGVDFVIGAHDHSPMVDVCDSIAYINSGSHARNVGHGTLTIRMEKGKIVSKTLSAKLIPMRPGMADASMRAAFDADYRKVKEFTLQPVGELTMSLSANEAFCGMSDYINFIHTVQMGCSPAQLSIAAPLKYNGHVERGTVLYNDLFTIYPFENQLYVIKMSGKEIKDYLEESYELWIQNPAAGHILLMRKADDARYGQSGWSLVNRSYNFDSMAGVSYTVDVTKPYGERIEMGTMASGEPFDITETYKVAVTSYRAAGGGGLLKKAGVDTDAIDSRIVARYPEIRELVYDYFCEHGTVTTELVSDPSVLGSWKFIPESLAGPALAKDMELLGR